jgi:DNA mismatch repair protein MutH
MTAVSGGLLASMEPIRRAADERDLDLLGLVRRRFEPYIGRTQGELAAEVGYAWPDGHAPKAITALVTKRILGVDEESRIAEFEKAGIRPKTIRLKRNDVPKEAMSFPAFDYARLAETDFEDSDFYGYLQQRYLFVIYREGEDGQYRLSEVALWQMPDADVEEARRCYEEMRKRVREGHAEESVRSTENRCCHVRPHGRDSHDTCMTPYGVPVVKKCFWLNQSYLAEEIAKLGS